MAVPRSDSPSATSGKGRDPGYVEVDGAGKPLGTADELDESTRRQVREGATLTADERTKVNEAKAEPKQDAAEKPVDDAPVQFARPGEEDTTPDGVNDADDAAETEASAVSETSPSEEDVAVADEEGGPEDPDAE